MQTITAVPELCQRPLVSFEEVWAHIALFSNTRRELDDNSQRSDFPLLPACSIPEQVLLLGG